MSLINQMLKDLETRRGQNAGKANLPANIRAVDESGGTRRAWPAYAGALAGLLALAAAARFYLGGSGHEAPPQQLAAEPIIPVAPVSQQPAAFAAPETSPQAVPSPPVALPVAPPAEAAPPLPPPTAPAYPLAVVQNAPAAIARMPVAGKPTAPAGGAIRSRVVSPPAVKPAGGHPRSIAAAQPDGYDDSAAQLYRRGANYFAAGQFDRAQDALERSLRLQPSQRDARLLLARSYAAGGDYAHAGEVLDERVELRADADVARLRAQLYLQQGRIAQAEKALELSAAADDPDQLGLLGALRQRQGRYGEAAGFYLQAARLQPGQSKWWLGLAISLEAGERFEEAADAYRRVAVVGAPNREAGAYVEARLAALNGNR